MRILFSSLAAYGHLFPLIPFAQAVQAEGHEIRFATGQDFASLLDGLGLRPVAVSQPLRSTRTTVHGTRIEGDDRTLDQTLWILGRVFGSDIPREFVDDLGPVIQDFAPDLVVHDVFNSGAGLAARYAGVPAVCHGLGRAPAGRLTEATDYHLRGFARELGITLPENFAIALGNHHLDIYPPSLQRPEFVAAGNRTELRPVSHAQPGELPPMVFDRRSGRPLIYVTLGTVFGEPAVLRALIDGLVPLGARVLVATGPTMDPADLGRLPELVSVQRWVPQARLWPHVDLAVHHGGSGTVLGGLAAGVRQVLVPRGADQLANARALTKAGAGEQILPDALTTETVTGSVERVLTDDSFRTAAQRLQTEIDAMPAPTDLARKLPDLVARARTR